MNERLLELAKQAGLKKEHGSDREYIGDFDWREFGELIVQECMHLVRDCYSEGSQYLTVCASTIIEDHFGVEE